MIAFGDINETDHSVIILNLNLAFNGGLLQSRDILEGRFMVLIPISHGQINNDLFNHQFMPYYSFPILSVVYHAKS